MTLKIFAGYEPTHEPWGGANNFLRALYKQLADEFEACIVFEPSSDCDIFFFGQTSKGPLKEGQYSSADIQTISNMNPNAPVLMRVVNTRLHSNHRTIISYLLNKKDRQTDANTINAAKSCDGIIFQSEYQKRFFRNQGLKPMMSTVVHNGAAKEFSEYTVQLPQIHEGKPLKILATSVSTKSSKRHNAISELASMNSVELSFAGTWPEGEGYGKVQLLGKLTHDEILNIAKECHYFFHPGIKESCSNSIVEALSMGLPVLYGIGEGSSAELVKGFGLPVPPQMDPKFIATIREMHSEISQKLNVARSSYSMQRAAQKYMAFFQTAIEAKRKLEQGGVKNATHR